MFTERREANTFHNSHTTCSQEFQVPCGDAHCVIHGSIAHTELDDMNHSEFSINEDPETRPMVSAVHACRARASEQ